MGLEAAAPFAEVGASVRYGPAPYQASVSADDDATTTPPVGLCLGGGLQAGRWGVLVGEVLEGQAVRHEGAAEREAVWRAESRLSVRATLGVPAAALHATVDVGVGLAAQRWSDWSTSATVGVRPAVGWRSGAWVAVDARIAPSRQLVALIHPPNVYTFRPGGPGVALVVGWRFGARP